MKDNQLSPKSAYPISMPPNKIPKEKSMNTETLAEIPKNSTAENQNEKIYSPNRENKENHKPKREIFRRTIPQEVKDFLKFTLITILSLIVAYGFFNNSENIACRSFIVLLFMSIITFSIKYIYKKTIKEIFNYTFFSILWPIFIFMLPVTLLVLISWALVIWPSGEYNLISEMNSLLSDLTILIILFVVSTPYLAMGLLVWDIHNNKSANLTPVGTDSSEGGSAGENNTLNEKILPLIKNQTRILLTLFPISTVASFVFVLYHYKELANGDLGLALQITSALFPENKITWAAITLAFLLIFYISFMPAISLKKIEPIVTRTSSRQENKIDSYKLYIMLIVTAASLTTFSNIIVIHIFKLVIEGNIAINIFLMTAISMATCFLPIYRAIMSQFKQKNTTSNDVLSTKIFKGILYVIMISILFITCSRASYFFLEYIPKGIGGIVANPGTTIETNENDYACVFSNDIKEKKSITFGVIVESKPDSVRIFTPEYNREKNSYGEEAENGKVNLNKLAESQVKIPGGYRIEKFDGFKHRYNLRTGKCEYVQTRYSLKEIFYKEYIENSKKPPHK